MFANLKNKIREETGGDLPQLGPKHQGHGRLSRGSKGGSTSSMCSEQDTSVLKANFPFSTFVQFINSNVSHCSTIIILYLA